MAKIYVSFFNFIPLVEIITSEVVREELRFLSKNKKYLEEIQIVFKNKKNRRKGFRNLHSFIPRYSNLKWDIYPDGFLYFQKARSLIYDEQPIRPLIPLSTHVIKWKLEGNYPVLKPRKKIRIYPILIAELEKKLSINELKFLKEKSWKKIKKEVINNCSYEKMYVINSVFKTNDNINIPISGILTIVECKSEDIPGFFENRTNLISFSIPDINFCFDRYQNTIYIIYDKTLPKIFKERVKIAVKIAFTLKLLIDRILYILDKGLFDDIDIFKKLELVEYIIQFINPEEFSSLFKQSNLLIKSYQKDVFDEIERITSIKNRFNNLKESLLKKLVKWEAYELAYLTKRKSVGCNKVIDELPKKFVNWEEPDISKKEKILLEFLVYKFIEKATVYEIKEGITIQKPVPTGSVTRNEIIRDINNWLKKRELDPKIITEKDLRDAYPPKIIRNLELKGLVVINETGKDKPKYYFSINTKSEYVKRMILEKHNIVFD